MEYTAKELSLLVNGTLEGDPDIKVNKPARIEDGKEGAVSFLANPKYEPFADTTKSSVLIVGKNFTLKNNSGVTLIRVEDPYSSFSRILDKFDRINNNVTGIDEHAHIAKTVKLGDNVYVGAFTYIADNVKIGDNVKIYPGGFIGEKVNIGDNTVIYAGVKIYNECEIGKDTIIHSGVVIGSDGFGFAPNSDGAYKKIAQIGNVVIEDNVEIGANTVIDRATIGATRIMKGVKLDNLIQVAHNVEIDENTVIAAQTGISGSTKIGKNCVIGGQVGFVGHLTIASGTKINAQSGISKSITIPNMAWNSSPAFEYKESLKSQVVFRNLPDLEKRVQELEEKIELMSKATIK